MYLDRGTVDGHGTVDHVRPVTHPLWTQGAHPRARLRTDPARLRTRHRDLRRHLRARRLQRAADLVVVAAERPKVRGSIPGRVQTEVIERFRHLLGRIGDEILEEVDRERISGGRRVPEYPTVGEDAVPEQGEGERAFAPVGQTDGRLRGVHEQILGNASLGPEVEDQSIPCGTFALHSYLALPGVAHPALSQLDKQTKHQLY